MSKYKQLAPVSKPRRKPPILFLLVVILIAVAVFIIGLNLMLAPTRDTLNAAIDARTSQAP